MLTIEHETQLRAIYRIGEGERLPEELLAVYKRARYAADALDVKITPQLMVAIALLSGVGFAKQQAAAEQAAEQPAECPALAELTGPLLGVPAPKFPDFEQMSMKQLERYAADHKIDFTGVQSKAAGRERIAAFLESVG